MKTRALRLLLIVAFVVATSPVLASSSPPSEVDVSIEEIETCDADIPCDTYYPEVYCFDGEILWQDVCNSHNSWCH